MIKRIIIVCMLLVIAVLFLLGCKKIHTSPYDKSAVSNSQELTVYTPHKEELYRPIIKEFEERTGIWVNIVTGGTNQLLELIKEEADMPKCDVMFGGGVESLEAYRDYFQPYRCTGYDFIAPIFQAEDKIWTGFSALPIVIIYNRKLIPDDKILESWQELIQPVYYNRIAFASPLISGSSYTALISMLTASKDGQGWEFIREFIKNLNGNLLDESADVYKSITEGRYTIGITLEESAKRQMDSGADVGFYYPREGTSAVPDGTAIVKGAVNEINAKAFIDFTINFDVQMKLSEMMRRSVRGDIKAPEGLPDIDEIPLISYDIQWAGENKVQILSHWNMLWKEYVR